MSAETVTIAIVGSGPAGLSAAAHAAERGIPHVLLESSPSYANTIQRYQKGKLVMAEPGYLPLRSPLDFQVGSRESVLAAWAQGLDRHKVDIRYNAEVKRIQGERGAFRIETVGGATVEAQYVVLAIGVQGNPRRVEAPGGDLPFVQYTLDDPDEYRDESIVVIGAGDAAIENALALAARNEVFIVNRGAEFARAKQANMEKIMAAIEDGSVKCYYKSNVARVEAAAGAPKPGVLTLKTENGEAQIACDRIIARLGAIPPRKFVESCGIAFPSAEPTALPTLSARYESSVPGLYVVGALAGYPLIKQAMNQGYEVVEYALGGDIRPADHELLVERLRPLPYELDVDVCLDLLRQRIPMFTQINPLMFREFMLESSIAVFGAGEVIYRAGDYTTSFYTVVDGEVTIGLDAGRGYTHTVRKGEFFGEMSLISGRRRSNTASAASDCILIETPRRLMNKLCASIDSVRKGIDEIFVARALQEAFTPDLEIDDLRQTARKAGLHRFGAGEFVFREGEEGERLHIVRRGALTLARDADAGSVVVGYAHSGEYVGEVSIMNVGRYTESARAEVATETISLGREDLLDLIAKDRALVGRMQGNLRARMANYIEMAAAPEKGRVVRFLMDHGLGEATDALLINETLCIGCNNCESACAGTHGGVSRLNREAGPSYAGIHVPIVCRHCEQPHCMKDCPPNAIHRTEAGEVFIDIETCIGCRNCESNCPYKVIRMVKPPAHDGERPRGLLARLGFGARAAASAHADDHGAKKAVKCDLCKDQAGGAACVRACPTGAAIRVGPDAYQALASRYTWMR